MDQLQGLDHGTRKVLVKMYPKADTPIVQLSIDSTQSAEWHHHFGKKLTRLREEGFMIITSGNTVHNLSMARWREEGGIYPWAEEVITMFKNL